MLSIPFSSDLSTPKTRKIYLDELRRAKADRAVLFIGNPFGAEPALTEIMGRLTENLAYFRENGFETAVWINGLGHGGQLAHETSARIGDYQRIIGLGNGLWADDSFCPLDPRFMAMYKDYVRRCAEAGAPFIMIDDDLRLAMHGPVALGCACPLHMAEFNRRARGAGLIDHDCTREELAGTLFVGEATPLRRVWLDLMGDTLRDFARSLREVVDSVDPSIRLGHCACLPTWDTDGVDSIELSRIFAGSTRPYLRLIGAAYWNVIHAFGATSLGTIVDAERMQMAWCRAIAPEMEIFSEGDLYPRPRVNTPSVYVEDFDQVLIANGQNDGILKYIFDYSYLPPFENGYVDRHVYFAPLREQIREAFAGKETAGVYVHEVMHKLADMDCTGLDEGRISNRLITSSAVFADAVSLPTSYVLNDHTPAALIFGENAKYMNDRLAHMPLILDAAAARILSAAGYDVGLAASEPMEVTTWEQYPDWGVPFPTEASGRFFRLTPADGAEVLSTFGDGAPVAYLYTRPDGNRVLVYAFDADRTNLNTYLIRGYARQDQLFKALRRMAPGALPAAVVKEPWMYVLCAKDEQGRMAVGLWNFANDLGYPRTVKLDRVYTSVTPIGETRGHLEGDTFVFDADCAIPSYAFAGFTVE